MNSSNLDRQVDDYDFKPRSDFWDLQTNNIYTQQPHAETKGDQTELPKSQITKKIIKKKVGAKSKKVTRKNKFGQDAIQIVSVSDIETVNTGKSKNACKFKVQFRYRNMRGDNKIKRATQRFGRSSKGDWYPQHGSELKRKQQMSRINDIQTPFTPGFWEAWLLCNKGTINESLCDMKNNLKIGVDYK